MNTRRSLDGRWGLGAGRWSESCVEKTINEHRCSELNLNTSIFFFCDRRTELPRCRPVPHDQRPSPHVKLCGLCRSWRMLAQSSCGNSCWHGVFDAPRVAGASIPISWIPPFAVAVVAYGSVVPDTILCSGSPRIGPEVAATVSGMTSMASQSRSPRRRLSSMVSRRRAALLALMLGVVGCGPPEVEYIHVTEGSNGFVAMSKVEYQEATAPAEPRQLEPAPTSALPTLPESLQDSPPSGPNLAVPPQVTAELNAPGPALESTLSGLPETALAAEPRQSEVMPMPSEPRIVPLQTSVKPTPDQTTEPNPASNAPALSNPELADKLQAYRTQTRVPTVGLDENELRAVNKPSNPQPELNTAAERAARRVAAGSRLVERGATLSGRQEFIGALQIIAEALDQQRHTNAHARALSAGLTALEEARDFVAANPQQRLPLDELVLGHQTPILQEVALDQLSNQDALQSYLKYAQQQLSSAGGDLLPAADALFALGKLHLLESQQAGNGAPRLELERAIMLFHAALVIEPKHSLAANEAGCGACAARPDERSQACVAAQCLAHGASFDLEEPGHGSRNIGRKPTRPARRTRKRGSQEPLASTHASDGAIGTRLDPSGGQRHVCASRAGQHV